MNEVHEFKKGDRVHLARTIGQQGATGTVIKETSPGWRQVAVELDPPHGDRVGIYEAWPENIDLIHQEAQP